ncbi:hypothetical protein [Nocardia sp. SSK8]|uniref:hypothetical protein n=1 Tax=Nocardia sp. SSK8 TaxID=3120154 RepID=UPI003008A391
MAGAVPGEYVTATAQDQRGHGLLDFRLFRRPLFALAILTGFLPLAAWSATAYLGATYLQSILDLTITRAALLTVPGALVLTVTAVLTPLLVERIGHATALIAAHVFIALGLLALLPTGPTSGLTWYLLATMIAAPEFAPRPPRNPPTHHRQARPISRVTATTTRRW